MKKYYVLPMFPYPSGFAMHVGHASNFLITEFVARAKRMQGYDVVFPIGYDSFGLPTENFAIKNNKSAWQATEDNVVYFEEQIKGINFSFDTDRTFKTSDPEYYKWTQRIFKKLFDNGLVYKKDGLVNRCNGCQTVLANDQVVDGKCERCETIIIQKKHPQWYIAITQYADQLIDDLDTVDRPEETKLTQKNWIGRSFGAEVDFEVVGQSNPGATDKQYIICDFDGVIADSFEAIAKAFSQVGHIPSLGKTFTFDDAEQYIKDYARKKPNHAKDTIFNAQQLQELEDDFKRVGKLVHELGIGLHREFVDALKEMNAQVAVVSSGSEEYIQPAMIKSGLETTHVLCYEDHHSKEEKIIHICKDWGVDPKQVYYITDSLADVYELQDFLGNNKIIGVTRGQCSRQELQTKLAPHCVMDEQKDIASHFGASSASSSITVFTTRPDTLYGVTAVVLAPEYGALDDLLNPSKKQELDAYRAKVATMNAIDRQSTERQKDGIDSGLFVRHPLTNELVPVWYADYVLMDYATGAVMMVPAHDERDYAFAQRYNINIRTVITGSSDGDECYTGPGTLINSSQFDGIDNETAKQAITQHLVSLGKGRAKKTFRLRDWSVSRQRYRGSPIPVYYTFEDNQKVPYFDSFDPQWTARPDLPVEVRKLVYVMLKDKASDRYLMLQWPNDLGVSCISGGVDDNEDWIVAAGREAAEESGYVDAQFVRQLGGEFHNYYYHPTKDKNFYSVCNAYLYEVDANGKQDLDPKEAAKHAPAWMTLEQIRAARDIESTILYILDVLEDKSSTHATTDRYNAYHPHPDKSKWIPHAIPEDELPVVLPLDLPNYKPAGKSPLEDHPTFKYYRKKAVVGLDGFIVDMIRVRTLLWIYDNIRNNAKYGGGEVYLIGGLGVAAHTGMVFRKNDDLDLMISGMTMSQIKDLCASTGLDFKNQTEEKVCFDYEGIEIEVFSAEGFSAYTKHLVNVEYDKMMMKEVEFLNISVKLLDPLFYLNFKRKVNEYYGSNGGERMKDLLDIQALEGKISIDDLQPKDHYYLRECDTLDTFMCSSFYYLRFLDAHNSEYLISPEKAQYMPVDLYVGGKEHSVGHLIYARFIYKFLKDIGAVQADSPEPFTKLIHQGMIQGPDGRKMSKRWGNIVDPLDVIKQYDADTLRTYIAFMGPIELQKNWNPEAVGGTNRFLKRFGRLVDMVNADPISSDVTSLIHQTIKGVTEDVDNLKFNTAISKMMIATNTLYDTGRVTTDVLKVLVLLLAPFAPQLCQTMRQALGYKGNVTEHEWPSYDATLAVSDTMELPIQFNGKTKGSLIVPRTIDQNQVLELVHKDPKLGKYVTGIIKKVIRVPGKICNIIL